MSGPIDQAMRQICEEKGLSYESVLETIQSALAAAYRKDFGDKKQNLEVIFDPETANIKAFDVKTVVPDVDLEEVEKTDEKRRELQEIRNEEVKVFLDARQDVPPELEEPIEVDGPTFNEKTEMMISEAKKVKDDAKIEEVLRMELPVPGEFGRMAAMTAKQVVMQKLREAEREVIYGEFKDFEDTVLIGTVQRREGRLVLVDLGRATGVMRAEDQVPSERYNSGDRLKFYVRSVTLTSRGPEILLSRTDKELVKALFDSEIPEVADGIVIIKDVAREPGNRTKVAVTTEDDSIDPIGACIGQRGMRIQTIIAEIGGEKIDIIHWSDNQEDYISNALSPAKVNFVELSDEVEGEEREVTVTVDDDQLSLAVGKGGQNVRLASRLCNVRISVQGPGAGDAKDSSDEKTSETEGETVEEPASEEAPDEEVAEETVEKSASEETPIEEAVEEPVVEEETEKTNEKTKEE